MDTAERLTRHLRNMSVGDELMFERAGKLVFGRALTIVIGDDPHIVTSDGDKVGIENIREVYYPNAAAVL